MGSQARSRRKLQTLPYPGTTPTDRDSSVPMLAFVLAVPPFVQSVS